MGEDLTTTHQALPRVETAQGAALQRAVEAIWPARVPSGQVGGLPAALVSALRPRRRPDALDRAAAILDRMIPGWVEIGSEAAPGPPWGGTRRRLCALLARRPVSRPEGLLSAIARAEGERRMWLLGALIGSDEAGVRHAWRQELDLAGRKPSAGPSCWMAFVRCVLAGWLTFADFRACLADGRALAAASRDGDYRPALRRLGLWDHRGFAKWYRELIYELAHQPDVGLSLQAGGWVRDFPGADYLWDALQQLARQPSWWWPMHVVRWTSGVDPANVETQDRLRAYPPAVLVLLSLLRADLCPAVGQALGAPQHEAVVSWLKAASARRALDLEWASQVLAPWAEVAGDGVTLAVGALCAVTPPSDFAGPAGEAARCRAFVRAHLLPEFDRVIANLNYVHALRGRHLDLLCEQAKRGHPQALRSLALRPEWAERAASIAFRVRRLSAGPARQAAEEALAIIGERAGVGDAGRLEGRLDMAAAWADAGLEGRSAKVWWDVGGYRVRLEVVGGKVEARAWAGGRRLGSLPRAVRSAREYPEIRAARAELAMAYHYFKSRLEQMMVEGAVHGGRAFAVLLANPVVRSLASRLVLEVDGEPCHWWPEGVIEEGEVVARVGAARAVGVVHPVALARAGSLESWQERMVALGIAQPIKQVFREIYLMGDGEGDREECLRFSGHALDARRAFALLRGRGYSPRRGDAVKLWPPLGLRAHLSWAQPAEDAGRQLGLPAGRQPVTSGPVWFETEAGRRLSLGKVPPVTFSETLRDADLLVSRAAAGELGFSSEETRRLRATLVRYLARALGLTCVYVGDDSGHALVEGQRATYRVNLGSGSVLLERSRRHLDLTWLPLGPTTSLLEESMDSLSARIVSTIAVLSRDEAISDPRFLSQLG